MIISRGRNYTFVHMPKTGGTSMALALEARAMADDILIGDTPKAIKRRKRLKALKAPGRLWKHSRLCDIEGMVDMPSDHFVFMLVRNPWDRLVSIYHWSRAQSFDHPMIQAALTLSFPEFVQKTEPILRKDQAVSYVKTRAGSVRCSAFIRLEHLQKDLKPVETHLGFKLAIPHVNRSIRPQTVDAYDAETRKIVASCYAEDIRQFGYRFPDGSLASTVSTP